MSGLALAATVGALVFALLGGVLGVYALRAWRGDIDPNSALAFRGASPRRSEATWVAANRQAAPFLVTAAAITLIQAAALLFIALWPAYLSGGYVAALVVSGVLLAALLVKLAARTVRRG